MRSAGLWSRSTHTPRWRRARARPITRTADRPDHEIEREIREEYGYRARAVKFAALIERRRHPHPPSVHHIYKLMFVCELTGGEAASSTETDAVGFFPLAALPELSTGRILAPQIERLYEHHLNRALPADFD